MWRCKRKQPGLLGLWSQDRNLTIDVYRKPTHTDQYLRFESHHPLKHKLGVIKTLQHRAKEIPTTTQGKQRRNRNTSKQHLKHVATQTGPSPKPLENETPKKKRMEINITAFLSCIFLEFRKDSEESSKNMTSRCNSNPQTPSETGSPQGQNTKAQTEQCCLWHTVPGRMQ